MTAPDPYRWPANDRGVIHPGIDAPGDCCNCKRCMADEMAAWVKAGRPEQTEQLPTEPNMGANE